MRVSLTSNPVMLLVDEIMRLQGRLKSLFDDVHIESGLSGMEDLVLTSVVESQTPPTVPQIGRSLGHPRQVIQRAANELVEAGLIEKVPNPNHKRAVLLQATQKGFQLKHQSDQQALAVANAFLCGVDATKCERVAKELRELRHAIETYSKSGDKS